MAEIDARKPKHTTPDGGGGGGGIIGGIVGVAGGAASAGTSGDAQAVGELHQISETGHWLGVIASNLTDRHMWISLGWLFLGWGLLGIGFFLLIRRTELWQNIRSAELAVAKTAARAV